MIGQGYFTDRKARMQSTLWLSIQICPFAASKCSRSRAAPPSGRRADYELAPPLENGLSALVGHGAPLPRSARRHFALPNEYQECHPGRSQEDGWEP